MHALAPLVRPLPCVEQGRDLPWMCFELDADLLLIASTGVVALPEWVRITAGFVPPASASVSRSSANGYRAMLVAEAGPAGVDLEAISRVACDATPRDAWLARAEQALVDQAREPVLELACHWVLKEAYGKALGVGLALPLDALVFASEQGVIVVRGAAAPLRDEHWRFGLYRRDDMLLAVAYR